jgi:Uma2 family endonuclease
MVAREEKLYTADDLWEITQRGENADKHFELVEGVIFEVSPSSAISSIIAIELAVFLRNYVKAHDLGFISGSDGTYNLGSGNVFAPDVAFVQKARLPQIPERFFPIPPDLTIEVLSATGSARATQRKAAKYLAAGTQAVWIVDPMSKEVDICRATDQGKMLIRTLTTEDTLDGGEVLPGFTLPVKAIFEVLG